MKKIKNSNSAPKLKQHFTVLMIEVMIPSGKVLFSASLIVSPCCAFHFFLTAVMNDFFWTARKYKLAEWLCELLSDTLWIFIPWSPEFDIKVILCSQCDLGEYCAIRKGSRIGKMCDCPRGAFCNFFLLKCLWAN